MRVTYIDYFTIVVRTPPCKKQGSERNENVSAERFFTEQFDQTASLRGICSGGYTLRDNPWLFPKADIRSAPLRNTLEKSAPLRDIFKGGYPLRNNP